MRTVTLQEMSDFIERLKKNQRRLDSECHLDNEEFCSYCRYVNGYWGDLKVRVEVVDE